MKEREDIAAALSQFMGEVLSKLRGRGVERGLDPADQALSAT